MYPISKHHHSLIPLYLPARKLGKQIKIPKVIYQTFESMIVDKSVSQCVQGWINLNPEYEYRYYTGADRRDFIEKYFDNRVLAAYDTLYPGAFKADLWRLCVLYQLGGVYCDIKLFPNHKLDSIIDEDLDAVLVIDLKCPLKRYYEDIHNAFMAFVPKHPLVLKFIEGIVDNVEKRFYGHHCLTITGPKFLGTVLRDEITKDNPDFKLEMGNFELPGILNKFKILRHKYDLKLLTHYIFDNDNNIVIYRRNIHNKDQAGGGSGYKGATGKQRYEVLFDNRQIYVNN